MYNQIIITSKLDSSSRLSNLNPAHATIRSHTPGIAANTLEVVEQRLGIPLLLDGGKTTPVVAVEGLLPVELVEVGLVHVSAAAGSDGLDLGHELVGDALLHREHVVPAKGIPGGGELHRHDGLAPGGVNSVGDALEGLEAAAAADGNDAVGGEVADHLLEVVVVVLNDGSGDETATVLVLGSTDVAVGERTHVGVVVVAVVEGGVGDHGLDANLGEVAGEWAEDLIADVVSGGVDEGDGLDDENTRGNVVDDGRTVVNHSGQKLVELGDGLVKGSLVDTGGSHLESSTSNGTSVVSSNSQGGDNSKVASAATAKSPVKVTVLESRSPDDSAGRSDNFELEGLISTEAVAGAESRVTTTKGEASETDGGTLARDGGEAVRVGKLNSIGTLDTGTELDSRAVVQLVGPLDDFGVLHEVSPDGERASASRAAKVAV